MMKMKWKKFNCR